MRLFYALELPRPVQASLAAGAGRWARRVPGAKWVAQENLHVTVRFLGEVGEGLLPTLQELGERAARSAGPVEISLDRLGAFPSPSRARVLWAGPSGPCPPFGRVVEEVEKGVQALGFPPEQKPAVPHVTLARLRVPQNLAPLLSGVELAPLLAAVRELTLMASELRPDGPRYTPVARWPLGG